MRPRRVYGGGLVGGLAGWDLGLGVVTSNGDRHRGLVVASFLRKGWGGLVGQTAVCSAYLAENVWVSSGQLALGTGSCPSLFAEKTRRLARILAKLFSFNII